MGRQTKPAHSRQQFRAVQRYSARYTHSVFELYAMHSNWCRLDVAQYNAEDGLFIESVQFLTGRKTLRALAFAILDATGGREEP